nr:hypothetical protein T02B11.3 - Caenorhabditis elegans [Caenorhabditis elegans]
MARLLSTLLLVSSISVVHVSAQANRAKILACIEPTLYNTPEDTTALIDKGKSCVISNSMSKAIPAMNLYSGFNSCTDLMALLDKMMTPFKNACKPVITKGLASLNTCKKNNKATGTAKQNACINKLYGDCMAMVTKQFVNKVCTALSKKMTAKEWNCCKQYAVKVVNVKGYACYNIIPQTFFSFSLKDNYEPSAKYPHREAKPRLERVSMKVLQREDGINYVAAVFTYNRISRNLSKNENFQFGKVSAQKDQAQEENRLLFVGIQKRPQPHLFDALHLIFEWTTKGVSKVFSNGMKIRLKVSLTEKASLENAVDSATVPKEGYLSDANKLKEILRRRREIP